VPDLVWTGGLLAAVGAAFLWGTSPGGPRRAGLGLCFGAVIVGIAGLAAAARLGGSPGWPWALAQAIPAAGFCAWVLLETAASRVLVALLGALALTGAWQVLDLAWPRPLAPGALVPRAHASPRFPLPPEGPAGSPPNPWRGARVFQAYGCGDCHSISALAGAEGRLGPPLDDIGRQAAGRVPGMSAEAYLRQSLEDPEAFVAQGFLRIMPKGIPQVMSPRDYEDLVAYLLSLKNAAASPGPGR
jgi:cytochrome c2